MRVSKHLFTVGILSLALATAVSIAPTSPAMAHGGDSVTITSTAPSNTLCGTPLQGNVTVISNVDFSVVTYSLDQTDSLGNVIKNLTTVTFNYADPTNLFTDTLFGFGWNGSVPDGSWIKLSITDSLTPGTTSSLLWQCHGFIGIPQVPTGFVQRQISCTTRLYWGADPKATVNGNNYLIQGQTWYVSSTAVKGTDGNQWTPVYVGSFDLIYVPTSCAFQNQTVVNAAPPTITTNNSVTYSFPFGLHS